MKDFSKAMESARLKAQARVKSFSRKTSQSGGDQDAEKFKREYVKIIMENPRILQDMMKAHPNEMKDLIQRYG